MTKYQSALIVDDQKEQIDLVKEYLQLQEIEATGVSNFYKFKETFLNEAPDLVILDISMPDHDGYDYISWIAEQNIATSMIFISGLGHEVLEIAKAMTEDSKIQVLESFQKPFTYENLESAFQ